RRRNQHRMSRYRLHALHYAFFADDRGHNHRALNPHHPRQRRIKRLHSANQAPFEDGRLAKGSDTRNGSSRHNGVGAANGQRKASRAADRKNIIAASITAFSKHGYVIPTAFGNSTRHPTWSHNSSPERNDLDAATALTFGM